VPHFVDRRSSRYDWWIKNFMECVCVCVCVLLRPHLPTQYFWQYKQTSGVCWQLCALVQAFSLVSSA
jgi:hypothetical protein